MSIKTDKEIIEAIRNGNDNEAIAYLYKEVLPGVVKFICKHGGSREEASDIFQDSIMNFYRNVISMSFKEDKYKIQGYLFTVSKNLWINRVHKTKRIVQMSDEGKEMVLHPEKNVLDDMISADRDALITKLFTSLDQKCIDILTLSVYNKFSMKEIAEKLGLSSDNVAKINNYRCKQKLIELVKTNKSLKAMLQ